MRQKEAIDWLEELAVRELTHHSEKHFSPTNMHGGGEWVSSPAKHDLGEAKAWITDVQSALESVFPPTHAVMKQWHGVFKPELAFEEVTRPDVVNAARAIVTSALSQLKSGQLPGLLDTVRAETVTAVLDQAETLVGKQYEVASAVLAGGALETHLRHLCAQHGLTWSGDGSIEKYNSAIGQERKKGNEIYSMGDGKLVTAWGDLRNRAAHDPSNFKPSAKEVHLAIDGIRQFVIRTS